MKTKNPPAERAVLKILAYAAVFGATVRPNELFGYQNESATFSEAELHEAADNLLQRGVIVRTKALADPGITQEKWQQVAKAVQFLQQFRTIESIWVTGSLAVGNIHRDDDVDLMIITAPERLWLTRSIMSVRDVFSRRVRRRHDLEPLVRNKWCCNLWLETESMQLPQFQHSLYTAREVIQAVPLFQRRPGLAEAFLLANDWVQTFLPQGYARALVRAQRLPVWPSLSHQLWPSWLLGKLNSLLFRLQKQRMQAYLQHEIVEAKRAFFHPGERAKEVQAEYERILRSLLQ